MIIDSEFICHFYGAIRLIGLAAKINTIGDRCHHVVVLLVWCEESHFVIENIGKYDVIFASYAVFTNRKRSKNPSLVQQNVLIFFHTN